MDTKPNRKARRSSPAFKFAARSARLTALWAAVIAATTPEAKVTAWAAWKAAS